VKKAVHDFKVLENKILNPTNFLLKLQSPEVLPEILPGQFVNIEIKNNSEVFLRRPFSVLETDCSQRTLSLIIKIVGKGSQTLSGVQPGESLSLVYPLGNGFSFPQMGEKILLVGGGSGVAPVLFLAKKAGLSKENIEIILGARTAADVIDAGEYSRFGQIHYTTEDGSVGTKGRVTDHILLKEKAAGFGRIYTCGPLPMMKAIARIAAQNDTFCEVSLENLMACGFGVCLCCIEPTDKGNQCVCTDGPVFNIKSLKWQI
jgi:dihydroorotate dehydrogenase electron transfer subunit